MAYDIGEAFQKIEDEMLASMSRNLKRHLNKEKEEGLNYSMWQAEQLKSLDEFKRNNAEAFKDYFGIVNEQLGEILKKCNENGQLEQEAKILEAIQEGWKIPSVSSKGVQGSFFKINERKLNALIKATKSDMAKAEAAMLRQANDVYRKTIFNAQVYYNTGAGTLSQCVDMATKDFLAKGITCVEYANGTRVGIDSYARMVLRTSQTRAYLMGESSKRDEWGINTVIVNKRGVACPLCLKWVGRVFYDDVWGSTPVPSPAKYPRLSTAMEGGLYHPNCRDIHTTYFEGISTPPKPMTKDQVDEANRVYALEQRQRYNERQIRKYKRLAQGSVDPDNVVKYSEKLQQWQNEQKQFINAHSDVLKRRAELEKVFDIPEKLQWGQNNYDFSQNNNDIINNNIKHEHIWIEEVVIPPTCEEKGEKIKKCSVCGEEGEKVDIPPIGHKWVEVSVTPPTCTQKGERLLRCENCGEEKTEEIPATGHQFGTPLVIAPTCTEEGYTFKKCTVCGHIEKYDIKPALGHDWGDWVITRQPTTALVGRKQATCKRCGAKKYGTVPKLKAPSPADQIKALEDSIKQLDVDIAALDQTSYTGIWKDVVTPSDYLSKKAGIPGKKQYFLDKIAAGDTSKDWQQFLDLVDEFEIKGKEYETLLSQRKNNQDALDLLKPNDAFSQSRKDAAKWFDKDHGGFSAADKYFDPSAKKIHGAATPREQDGFYTYTAGSGGLNRPLAGFQKPYGNASDTGWEQKYYVGPNKVWIDYEGKGEQIRGLTTLIEKSTYPDDVWLQSGQGFGTIEGFLGLKPGTLQYMTDAELQRYVGRDGVITNFISTAVNEGGGSIFNRKPLKINFYAPRGSQMLYASDVGAFGKGENEMILQRGGFYRIKKIYWGNDATDNNKRKIFVDMEIHPEKGYDLFQQDPNEWKGSKKNYKNP